MLLLYWHPIPDLHLLSVSSPTIAETAAKVLTVEQKILVLSGKREVGKSTLSAHLAHALASDRTKVVF